MSKERQMSGYLGKIAGVFAGRGLDRFCLVRKATDIIYRRSAKGKKVILCNIQGSKMLLDASDLVVSKTLYFTGVWEKEVTSLIKVITKQGMVFVDIGANIGYFTLLGAKLVGKTGKVFAFEPDVNNYALLTKNIELNMYDNVALANKAVTNRVNTANLFIDTENSGNHKLWASSKEQEQVSVGTTSIDSFLESYNVCSSIIVKMDIQGAEMAALQGMDKLIRANPDIKLIIEFWPAGIRGYGDSPKELLDRLLKYDFNIYRITTRGLKATDISYLLKLCEHETIEDEEKQLKFINIYCEKENRL